LDIALDIELKIALDLDLVYNDFSKTPLIRSPGTPGSHPSPDSNANASPRYPDNPRKWVPVHVEVGVLPVVM